jgi:hypothetical protein
MHDNSTRPGVVALPLYGLAVVVGVTGGLLYSAGAVLLGVALWRAGTLPLWTGSLYAVAVPLISIVGLAVGWPSRLGPCCSSSAERGLPVRSGRGRFALVLPARLAASHPQSDPAGEMIDRQS